MTAYYNENDPFAAATIREAMVRGLVAPGVVDERDIRDVRPSDLVGFVQIHLFAGGGIWSYALRNAGWPDSRPVWTCSCPCQPFSSAGKGEGFADERHLWPAAHWLVTQLEPECLVGEQVADKGADAWLDLVQSDLEGMDYAFGCVPLASAGFGAPNPRHRSFWMAYAARCGQPRFGGGGQEGAPEHRGLGGVGNADRQHAGRDGGASASPQRGSELRAVGHASGPPGAAGGLVYAHPERLGEARQSGTRERVALRSDIGRLADPSFIGRSESRECGISAGSGRSGQCGDADGVANALRAGRPERRPIAGNGSTSGSGGPGPGNPGPTNGFWADVDWLLCRDPGGPRWRPVDAGTFPLAPSHPARVGGLRLSGNAINAEVAKGFIEAVMDFYKVKEMLSD